jgi:glycosyltransferase involved in cell wall biosynthesis
MKKILSIPEESFPTHEPFLGEVYSKEDNIFKTVFLMKTDKINAKKVIWNKSSVYLIKKKPRLNLIKHINTYFKIDLRYLYMIPYLVFKEKIDIIQVRDITFPLLVSLFLKYFFNKKVVYQKSFPHERNKIKSAKDNEYNSKLPQLLYWSAIAENKILHKMMYYCDAVFPITHYMAKDLNKLYNIPNEKIYPFGMGFNFDNLVCLSKKNKDNDSIFRFVYTGVIGKKRGFDVLLNGVSQYFNKYKNYNVTFDFIGGENEKNELDHFKELTQTLKLENFVNFFGKLDRYKVYELLPGYQVGISWFGTLKRFQCASPTKLMEYLGFGIPFLATDSVRMHNDIKEATGAGIITKNSADDVCDKINQCINNYPELSKNALKNGRDYIRENNNYQKMKIQLADIYAKI